MAQPVSDPWLVLREIAKKHSGTVGVGIAILEAQEAVETEHQQQIMTLHRLRAMDAANCLDEQQRLREQVEEQAELHRMQFAAVGAAALGNTRNSVFERITRESPYWTLAYADVCSAVDREIDLREQLETAKDRIYQLEQGRLAERRQIANLQAEVKTLQEHLADADRMLTELGS